MHIRNSNSQYTVQTQKGTWYLDETRKNGRKINRPYTNSEETEKGGGGC